VSLTSRFGSGRSGSPDAEAKLLTRWLVYIATDLMLTSGGVPDACHDVGQLRLLAVTQSRHKMTSGLEHQGRG